MFQMTGHWVIFLLIIEQYKVFPAAGAAGKYIKGFSDGYICILK